MRISVFELACLVLLSALLIISLLTLLAANNGISTTLKEIRDLLSNINTMLSRELPEIKSSVDQTREYLKDINASVHRIELLLKGIKEILLDECVIQPERAVLALRMDECNGSTAHDSSNHGNDGSIYNASWTKGLTGCGLAFDGYGYVEVNDSEPLHILHNLTVEFWAKTPPDAQGVIMIKGFNTTWLKYMFKILFNDSQITWGVCTASYEHEISSLAPDPGKWHHYALVIRTLGRRKELRAFVDGEILNATEITPEVLNFQPGVSLKIGRLPNMRGFKGIIDEVYIYREALDDRELYRHYICGKLAHTLSWLNSN